MKKKRNIDKRILSSNRVYNLIKIVRPIISKKFKPIILHSENIARDLDCGLVIAPNHQSTLDPIIITAIINRNIHWAALKRFFDATDSIFNNSKNPFLCHFTASMFRKLEYFPIERIRDNPRANNLHSVKEMITFLKKKQYIGIFPEGTTNKTANDFGTFENGFVKMASLTNSHIQPITVLWVKKSEIPNKIIVNIGKAFETNNMSEQEIYDKYLNMQRELLYENKQKCQELTKILTVNLEKEKMV